VVALVYKSQENQPEYDPANMLGRWLDSAKDMFIPKYTDPNTFRRVPMVPKSSRFMGQMYIEDTDQCGNASQRFVVPSPCSEALYMALGLPFCMFAHWLTLWRPLLPYGYNYNVSCARPGKPSFVIFDIRAL